MVFMAYWIYAYLCSMKNKEGVNRKKEYYDGLKTVVSEPLDEDYKTSIETLMGLESVSPEAKGTMLFSTEVLQPFINALSYIVNNRFIVEDKAFLMENDTDDPPLTPLEIFDVLDYLIPSTVREFLGVLKIDSVKMEKLFGYWLDDNTDGFIALLQKENCDLNRISRLCRCCWDDAFSVCEIPHSEAPMMVETLSGVVKHSERQDEQQIKESADQMLQSIEEVEEAEEKKAFRISGLIKMAGGVLIFIFGCILYNLTMEAGRVFVFNYLVWAIAVFLFIVGIEQLIRGLNFGKD